MGSLVLLKVDDFKDGDRVHGVPRDERSALELAQEGLNVAVVIREDAPFELAGFILDAAGAIRFGQEPKEQQPRQGREATRILRRKKRWFDGPRTAHHFAPFRFFRQP